MVLKKGRRGRRIRKAEFTNEGVFIISEKIAEWAPKALFLCGHV